MNNNFNSNLIQAIKILFNVQTIVPFLIGSLCLGIFSNAIYDTIKKLVGESIPSFLAIAGSSFLIFVFAAVIFTVKLIRAAQPKSDPLLVGKDNPGRYQGLILLVSRQQPCQVAIDYHLPKLTQCWLICSRKTQPEAEAIRAIYENKISIPDPILINDVYDPLEYVRVIDKIYAYAIGQGWKESDIIADFAGMTANGSVGMALLCYAKNRPLQYTPAVVDQQTDRRLFRDKYAKIIYLA